MKPPKPNIVFILVDDMGYGDFSAFNHGLSSTPTLDALMRESLCLTQHYTASPVCNPSRAALLTGRYPHRTGSIDTLEWRGLERLALRETTLADIFKSHGYATGLVGKWHLGAFDPRYHPNRRGFDEAVCFRGGMHDYYQWRLEYNQQVVRSDGRYLTDVFTQEAVNFIHRHQREPFFLHLTYNAPHTPLQVPEEERTPFLEKGTFTRGVSTVYGMIRRMDHGVERILNTLRELRLEENTILFFTSDNGPQFGGSGEACLNRFNCHFNGAKGSVYEGGIRVPMLIRGAGMPAGKSMDCMVHFCDWFPTILNMAGIAVPSGLHLDGMNILPLLRGEKEEMPMTRCWQWNRYTPLPTCNAAIRDGDWKLIRPAIPEAMAVPDLHWLQTSMYQPEYFIQHGIIRLPDPPRWIPDPPPMELYNIRLDPTESRNLAIEHPDIVHQLSQKLENWFQEVEAERLTIHDNV